MTKRSDYEVGYGKPPRHSQFKKGQSGCPTGRPRRKSSVPEFPVIDPTRTFILQEAARPVTVREGDRTLAIPTTQAVMRALGVKAMQGGVIAARTFLEHQLREDERERERRETVFKMWQDYVAETRAAFQRAQSGGAPDSGMFPHPDDVIFDYTARQVSIVGPCDADAAAKVAARRADAEFYFEMMVFCAEAQHGMPTDARPVYGAFTLLFAVTIASLPPRLRALDDAFHDGVRRRAIGLRRDWISNLQARGQERGLNVDLRKLRTRFFDLRDLGVRFVDGILVPYRWPKWQTDGIQGA